MSGYLARLLEVLAAKRTTTEKKKDQSLLKRKLEEKAAKDELRKKAEPALDSQPSAPTQNTQKADIDTVESSVEKIQRMDAPNLFLINANVTTEQDDREVAQANLETFLGVPAVTEMLSRSTKILNKNGIHGWICEQRDMEELTFQAFHVSLVHYPLDEPTAPLPEEMSDTNLFDKLDIKLEEADPVKIKKNLNAQWAPIAQKLSEVTKPEKEKENPEETEKEDKPQTKDTGMEFRPGDNEDLFPADDKKKDEEKEEDLDVTDEDDVPSINVGRFRALKDPHIFILDPRKSASGEGGVAEYQNFLGPDEPGARRRASVVLDRAVKFLASKKVRSPQPENLPVLVYFLNGADAKSLLAELKRERPHYLLSAFDKKLFDEDEPFSKLTIGNVVVNEALTKEMNRAWLTATSEMSGNPYPSVATGTSTPLDFFRFLSKKHRPIQIYIGGRPAGSGSEGTIYVRAHDKHEADVFVQLMGKFKMPSLFYEKLSSYSDIDAGFKATDPEEMTPANVLVLFAKTHFDPKAPVEVTEDSREFIESIPSKGKEGVTQLEALHEFAKTELKNKTLKAGAFVKSPNSIGTHVAQFNANMTICFLWGSLTQHVPLKPEDVLKKLPFVKTVNTNYL